VVVEVNKGSEDVELVVDGVGKLEVFCVELAITKVELKVSFEEV